MKQHYDVIIMGAGMVGASLAIALLDHAADLGLNIALVEPNDQHAGLLNGDVFADDVKSVDLQPTYHTSFDARSTALAYGSSKIFEQLSVWQQLHTQIQPISHIHVSDKGHFGATRLAAAQENVAALGYVVQNKWLGDVLNRHIQQHANREFLDVFCPASVQSIERLEGKTKLTIERAKQCLSLSADLVVMADGGRSSLREKLGISYTEHDYQQHALVCNLEIDRDHKSTAYERFTDSGPIALLPLQGSHRKHYCALIWTIPQGEIEKVLLLNDKAFLAQLQQRFGYRAGRFLKVGERVSYPLSLQKAQEQVRAGLAIVGNAAHTLHPIAGQGFNLALRGMASLALHIVDASRNQVNLGDYTMLKSFQDSRISDQQITINFSDLSMHMFSNNNAIMSAGRDLGLQLLDVCPAAKSVFARHAMGLASPMSELK
jgi:2-octaprenyl-6-methoxyphenol hydroxylase